MADTLTWEDAIEALTRHARLDSTEDETKVAFHVAANWLFKKRSEDILATPDWKTQIQEWKTLRK